MLATRYIQTLLPGLITVFVVVLCIQVVQLGLFHSGIIGVIMGLISAWVFAVAAKKRKRSE